MKSFLLLLVLRLGSGTKRVVRLFTHTRRRVVTTLMVIIVLGLLVFRGRVLAVFSSRPGNSPKVSASAASDRDAGTIILGKSFQFSINDGKGREVTKLNYTVDSGVLTQTIIVQGQQGTAAPGRKFLVLSLKLRNDSNQSVRLNTRDYVRVAVGSGNDLLAADIHNDPVDVQPISTKFTRLGFPVDDSAQNFKIQVGEINGSKNSFDLNFK